MKNIQLSKNFYLYELIYSEALKKYLPVNKDQIEVLKKLCNYLLQPIRDYINYPIHINSGFRDWKTLITLKEEGYQASYTSDHLIPGKIITNAEFQKYFNSSIQKYKLTASKIFPNIINPFASGAADFIIPKFSKQDMYKLFIELKDRLKDYYNQIIFYPESNTGFIHISLDRALVYPFQMKSSKPICFSLNRQYISFEEGNEYVKKILKI